jgi:hypothetical protein
MEMATLHVTPLFACSSLDLTAGDRTIAMQDVEKRNRVSIETKGAMTLAPLDSQQLSTIRHTSQRLFGLARKTNLSVLFAICPERVAIAPKYFPPKYPLFNHYLALP